MGFNRAQRTPEDDLVRDNLSYYSDLNAARRKWRELMAEGDYNSAWRQCLAIHSQLENRFLKLVLSPSQAIERAKVALRYTETVAKLNLTPGTSGEQVDRLRKSNLDALKISIANRLYMASNTAVLDRCDALHKTDTRIRGENHGTEDRESLLSG